MQVFGKNSRLNISIFQYLQCIRCIIPDRSKIRFPFDRSQSYRLMAVSAAIVIMHMYSQQLFLQPFHGFRKIPAINVGMSRIQKCQSLRITFKQCQIFFKIKKQ